MKAFSLKFTLIPIASLPVFNKSIPSIHSFESNSLFLTSLSSALIQTASLFPSFSFLSFISLEHEFSSVFFLSLLFLLLSTSYDPSVSLAFSNIISIFVSFFTSKIAFFFSTALLLCGIRGIDIWEEVASFW